MASPDVIELGSSDDDAEPVPKKKKPALNAMVHFPNKVSGLKVNPPKPVIPNLQKVLAGGAVTITNVKTGKVPPQVIKVKTNGKAVHKVSPKFPINIPVVKSASTPTPMGMKSNLAVNPLSFRKNVPNIKVQSPKLYLPPGITVKRTAPDLKILPADTVSRKRQNVRKKPRIITTVELDDEEVPLTSDVSPQWYLRPEEQNRSAQKLKEETNDKQNNTKKTENNMELENNKEPDKSKYIEITIEDSPIKAIPIKKGFEVGTQLAIIIEDSPVKPAKEQPSASGSDSEISKPISEPQSKKKLDYPKGEEELLNFNMETQNIIEIDLERAPSAEDSTITRIDNKKISQENETKEKMEIQKVKIPTRVQTVHISKEVEKSNEPKADKQQGQANDCIEFHPVYQKFINLCFELENSDDMTKIVDKKIKTYYRQCPKDYVESEEFTDMVSSKIFAMKAAPDKMYLYIKDIVDELNLQRKTAKTTLISNIECKKAETEKYFRAEDPKYDSKRRKQIRKLEKTIKKLHRAIQKLEEQEVEFEDEEDSVYLLTERYKERLIRVHAKFCQLTNTKMPSEPRIQIEARPGQPTGPAKKLEKWVNRKVPIGTPLPFPDFHDVLRCVRDANEEDRLGWNEADIMEEARDLFTRCGKKLQRRRQENEWRIAASRISHDVSTVDPAENSDLLKKRLEENKSLAAKKELELLNKYADKQNQLKLVGEEIGDKEAEESPVESEDDDVNDESNSLEDKQKRKERLRRLLHEKTRKMSTEKENISSIELKVNKEETNNVTEGDQKKECEPVIEVNEITRKEENEEPIQKSDDITFISNDNSSRKDGPSDDAPSKDQKHESSKGSDMYDVDSDIDELHLLQKLYSENEINSSTQESDSDTPIAISDTLDSDSETEKVKKQQNYDIISIENSSYSESEITKEDLIELEPDSKKIKKNNLLLVNLEIELPSKPSSKCHTDDENILLASSDEEKDITPVHIDQIEDNKVACNVKISDGGTIASNYVVSEYVLHNSEENSVENDITDDVITETKKTHDEVVDMIVDDCDDKMVHSHEDHSHTVDELGLKEKDVRRVDSINTESMVENDGDNIEGLDSTINDAVITNEESCYANKYLAVEDLCENNVNNPVDDNHEDDKNHGKNSMANDDSAYDKEKLNITANVTSMNHEDNLKVQITQVKPDNKSNEAHDILEKNYASASNSVKTVLTEQDLNECEVSEAVNVDSSDPLTKQQNPSEDVDVSDMQCI